MHDSGLNEKIDRLKFYRNECSFEFGLLSSRVTWFVTCQSFLIVPMAISMGYPTASFNWLAGILLPAVGIVTSLLVAPGLYAARSTADKWLQKQRELFEQEMGNVEFQRYAIDRDAHRLAGDRIHLLSLLFSSSIWIVFLVFWLATAFAQHVYPIGIGAP
ncbi:MAG: hypothetical protein ABJQ29_15075 [Luteolibacter sp.]